jgi:hypothetical protein
LVRQGIGQGDERGLVGRRGQFGHQLERPVEPGSEALGQQVVGLAGRGVGRVAAGVVQSEVEAEERESDHHDGG